MKFFNIHDSIVSNLLLHTSRPSLTKVSCIPSRSTRSCIAYPTSKVNEGGQSDRDYPPSAIGIRHRPANAMLLRDNLLCHEHLSRLSRADVDRSMFFPNPPCSSDAHGFASVGRKSGIHSTNTWQPWSSMIMRNQSSSLELLVKFSSE